MAESGELAQEFEIDGLAVGGRGVGRPAGVVWFVPGGLPGDRVLAEPRRSHGRYVEARLLRVLEASPGRREPPCPIQHRCGGCPWMPLAPREQRNWKRRLVAETLERIGGFRDLEVEPVRAGTRDLAYRNKVELSLSADGGGPRMIGLHESGTASRLVDVERCLLLPDSANAVLGTARELLLGRRVAATGTGRAGTHRLVIRCSSSTGEILVVLHETDVPFPAASSLAARLVERHPEVRGVVRLRSHGRRGGARTRTIAGRDWIEETIGTTTFRLPAASFAQVNSEMAAVVAELVCELAQEVRGAAVLDLYGGLGLHGLALARRGARVRVCDADRAAIHFARQTAGRNHLPGVKFFHGDVADFLKDHPGESGEVVVANPPRAGLGPAVAAAIANRAARRVVLVSCDPATLARDARALAAGGYRPRRVVPIDLFPQTAHVETVLSMSRDGH